MEKETMQGGMSRAVVSLAIKDLLSKKGENIIVLDPKGDDNEIIRDSKERKSAE